MEASGRELADFVTFDSPPVNEVVLSVQFATSVTDDATTLGMFWPKVRDDYPQVEQQPPLPPMMEEFGATPGINFQFLGAQLPSRYWFLSADGTRLIQVQADRLTFNWRREPADQPYPRYRVLREEFVRIVNVFQETAAELGRVLQPTWCEVSYINPVEAGEPGGTTRDLSTVLRRVAPAETQVDLSASGMAVASEDVVLQERYRLIRGGEPVGRLYIAANPALRVTDSAPIYMVNLTARGMSATPTVEGALDFLDFGRELVVKHFRDMTTDAVHDEWGLEDAD